VFASAYPSDEAQPSAAATSSTPEKSRCVFHVAQHMTTSMPIRTESLEIRERGSTKIYLTSGSDEIEAHSLISELHYSKRPIRRNNRRAAEMAAAAQQQGQFGPGWFTWRNWKVDTSLIQDFSTYIGKKITFGLSFVPGILQPHYQYLLLVPHFKVLSHELGAACTWSLWIDLRKY